MSDPAAGAKIDYDQIARRYDSFRGGRGPYQEFLVELADAHCARRILEIGAGTGNNMFAFHAAYPSAAFFACDLSRGMILRAQEKQAPGAWLRADAQHLPFAAQSFDLCFGCYMLHYIDDLNALAGECARVLQAGCAAFITASHEFIERHPMNRYFPSFAAIDKARFPDIEVVKQALARAGFLEPAVERLAVPQIPIDADYLTRVENRFISTFDLLPEEEFNAGLARLRADIQAQGGSLDIENVWESVVVWARKAAG